MTEETKDFVIKDRRFSAQEDKTQESSDEQKGGLIAGKGEALSREK